MIERDDHIPPLAELCAELDAGARGRQPRAGCGRGRAHRCTRGTIRNRSAMTSLARIQGDFQDYLLRGSEAVEPRTCSARRGCRSRRASASTPGPTAAGWSMRCAVITRRWPSSSGRRTSRRWARTTCAHTTRRSSPSATTATRCRSFSRGDQGYAEVAVLAELARWEWALSTVFDAADAAPLPPESLARIAPEEWAQLRFSGTRACAAWRSPGTCRSCGRR